jgi:gliding motility-associated-like protein
VLGYIIKFGLKSGANKDVVHTLLLYCLLILLFLSPSLLFSQTEISGIINEYSAVESIGLDNQSVTVNNPEIFQAGDTVLLIQMKGLGILTSPPQDYGKHQDMNDAGNYEFLLVDEVTGNTVSFTREFLKQYNAFEKAQLIRVRGYENATVTNTLTAPEWDGDKGGVMAVIVTNTLKLEANIDLSAIGFRGGEPVTLPSPGNICASSDPTAYEGLSFPEGSDKAGRKGEGPVSYYLDGVTNIPLENDFVQGRGRLGTGGGGGNGLFAGGGGGSNSGQGGFGGNETDICASPPFEPGGIGGYWLVDQLRNTEGVFLNRFYMAGAGGGSTHFGDRLASTGGRGGGMVIIIANHIESTNEFGIYADGGTVTQIATAGAGGGGGGGTIVTSVDNYSGNLNLFARGGGGGDVNHSDKGGPGGGGGGGTIIHSGIAFPGIVNPVILPGASGTNIMQNDPHGSTIGTPGGTIEELEISLNGLLFNGIQTDRVLVCEDTAPGLIEGTQPRGGIRPYIYEWFIKTEGSEWTIIEGANEKDYQPAPVSEITRFLRVVKDQDDDPVIDSSNYLTITIQPKIIGNIISEEQSICEGETPLALSGEIPTQGGNGLFEYRWNESMDEGQEWVEAVNDNENLSYTPPPLFNSTLYFRIAHSGVCTDTSNIVAVDVHPLISNNVLEDDQTICHGDTPQPVSSPDQVTGGLGEGSYTYTWESSINGVWINVDDSDNTAFYQPGSLTGTIRYRRVVESGACQDISSPQTITVLPLITGNSISGNQTICYLDAPEIFEGSEPEGGDGNYSYLWEVSADATFWSTAEGEADNHDYLSPALSEELSFRRIVYSGINNVCEDISNVVSVEFHPPSFAEIVETTDTVCVGTQSDISFIISGEGPWDLVFTNGEENYTAEGISNASHSTSVNPETQDYATYSYKIISLTDKFGCSATDDNITGEAKITVYAFPQPNPGPDTEVCGRVIELNAGPVIGTGIWDAGPSAAVFTPDANMPNPSVTVEEYGTHQFRWTETNWQCLASAEISVTFYEQPSEVFAGDDQSLHFIFETGMEAELPAGISSVYGIWEQLEGSGNIVFPDDPGTPVTDLGFGENLFLWTVYNGVCEPVSDRVIIRIRDLDAPTGFSPNNSGFNDRFEIRGLENSSVNELTIFNRQGNVVYQAVNYRNDWEGRNQDGVPLPEDTYYYILSVDNRYSYKGFILLKR